MFRSLNVAATGMAAQETKLDTIANNLANSNTTGYKRQDAQFEDLFYQTQREQVQVGSGVRVVSTSRGFAQGAIQQTGNPLDVAIEGSGFLAVTRPSGDIAYTRAGHLKTDANGRLCDSAGLPVEPPITVPTDATQVTIAADGTVSATTPSQRTPAQLGQLQVVMFPNPEGLAALGHDLYAPTGQSGEPTSGAPGTDGRGTLLQGAVEGSNVEMVNEMVGLIRTQRAYEINSKVISAADEMLRNASQVR